MLPKIDLKAIYDFSKFIRHPFEAIGMVANHYALRVSRRIVIRYETVSDQPILRICSESPANKWHDIRDAIYQSDNAQPYIPFEDKLEYACYRIASRFLIVNK